MAPLHRKRPRQFIRSYSFERVAVLGRIILLLSPGLQSWHALRLRSGCSGPPGYTMLYTRLPLASTCVSPAAAAAAAGRTQEQQAEPRSSRQNLGAAGRTKNHNQAQAGRTRHKRAEPSSAEPRTQQQQAAAGSSRQQQAERSNSRQNPAAARRTQRKRAEPSTSRQIPAGTDSNRRGQNHTEPKYDKFQWARLPRNY